MTDSTQNPYTDPNPNPNPNPSSSSSIPSLTESSSTRSTLLHVGEIDVNEGEGQQQADAEGLEQRMGAIGLEDAAVPVPAGAGAGGDKQTDRATTGGGGQEHVGDGGRDGDVKEWVGQELEEDEQAYSVQGEAEREGVEVDVGLDEDVWDGLDPVVKYTAWIYEWTVSIGLLLGFLCVCVCVCVFFSFRRSVSLVPVLPLCSHSAPTWLRMF